jgi:hypothetical protein
MCVHVVWQAVGCADRVDSITHQGCGTVRALLCRHVVVLVWHCASVLRIHTICLASFCSHLQMLHDTFSAFGVIINTPKIMRDPDTGMQTTTVWVGGGDQLVGCNTSTGNMASLLRAMFSQGTVFRLFDIWYSGLLWVQIAAKRQPLLVCTKVCVWPTQRVPID